MASLTFAREESEKSRKSHRDHDETRANASRPYRVFAGAATADRDVDAPRKPTMITLVEGNERTRKVMIDSTKKTRPRQTGSDVLMRTAEVAKVLAMSQTSVRGLIESGQLPAVRMDRHYRIWKSDVDALLTRSRVGV